MVIVKFFHNFEVEYCTSYPNILYSNSSFALVYILHYLIYGIIIIIIYKKYQFYLLYILYLISFSFKCHTLTDTEVKQETYSRDLSDAMVPNIFPPI